MNAVSRGGSFDAEIAGLTDNDARDKYLRSDKGRLFSRNVRSQAALADDVAARILGGEGASILGDKGIALATRVQTSNDKLLELAFAYAGGSVEQLMAGRYNEGVNAGDVRKQVETATNARSDALGQIRRMQEGGGRNFGGAEGRLAISGRMKVSHMSVMVAEGMTLGEEQQVLEYQELLKRKSEAGGSPSQALMDRLETSRKAVQGIADRVAGGDMSTMTEAGNVLSQLREDGKKGSRKSSLGDDEARKLGEDLLGQYGIRGDGNSLKSLMQTERGRHVAEALRAGHADLAKMGRGQSTGSDADIVLGMYEQFNQDKGKFASMYGSKASEEMALQAASGFFDYDAKNRKGLRSADEDLFKRRLEGGDIDREAKPVKIEIPDGVTVKVSGKIDVEGKVDANGVTASGVNAAPAGKN